ncbi:MAG: hypothetical protein ACR2NO_11980 [Chloroflexota bacterium]
MATVQLTGSAGRTAGRDAAAGRRRAARLPAGWMLVEAHTGEAGRKLAGRLLDTSAGGLGLVLSEELTTGSVVRITPASASREDAEVAYAGQRADGAYGDGTPWSGRQARVAYAAPLPGGSWRIGLTFTSPAPNSLHMWGTRMVLLAVFLLAAFSAVSTQGAGSTAGVVFGAIAFSLAIGAEWQHRAEIRAFRQT